VPLELITRGSIPAKDKEMRQKSLSERTGGKLSFISDFREL
jgi:hypothetical protein